MPDYAVLDAADVPGEGPGGAVRFLRRRLGATAFGFNEFVLGPDVQGMEHDETRSGQEEVIVVLSGSGTLRVGEEDVTLTPGRYVLVQPSATRCPTAGPDGLRFLTIGSPASEPYVARGPF